MRIPFREEAGRIFLIALVISAAWHLLWLSVVTVVTVQPPAAAVKFSGVSFLGPILERGALSVRISPRQETLLEKRYVRTVQEMARTASGRAGVSPHDDPASRIAARIEARQQSGNEDK